MPDIVTRDTTQIDGEHSREERLAIGLGWFSIGLGLAQAVAPGAMTRLIGLPNDERTRGLMQTFGVREIASGVAVLRSGPDPVWLWARAAGDGLDMAVLTRALNDRRADRTRVSMAMAAVGGAAAADVYTALALTRAREGPAATRSTGREPVRISKALTINRQPEVVYSFWRRLENLPRFMRHLESVEVLDERRSRWRAKAPVGMSVSWEAEITEDRPNDLLAWRSVEGSTIPNRGSVRFVAAPGARGTEVRVDLEYSAPGGRIGRLLAKLFGEEPGQQVEDDLRRLKQLLEAGEIAVAGTPRGLRRPAQPAAQGTRERVTSPGLLEGERP